MTAVRVRTIFSDHFDATRSLFDLGRQFGLGMERVRPGAYVSKCPLPRCPGIESVEVLDQTKLPALVWETLPARPSCHVYPDTATSTLKDIGGRWLCFACGGIGGAGAMIFAAVANLTIDNFDNEKALCQRLGWVWEAARVQGWLNGLAPLPVDLLGYVCGFGVPAPQGLRPSEWSPAASASRIRAIGTLDRLTAELLRKLKPIKAAELATDWALAHLPLSLHEVESTINATAGRMLAADTKETSHGA
jgi:hypothetical protein